MLTYYATITTIALADTSIVSHNYRLFFVVRTLEVYSLNNFQVYNMVLLAIITRIYTRSLELTHLITGNLCILCPTAGDTTSPSNYTQCCSCPTRCKSDIWVLWGCIKPNHHHSYILLWDPENGLWDGDIPLYYIFTP